MKVHRNLLDLSFILSAVVMVVIVCVLSYRSDLAYREALSPNGEVDLLKGNLNDHWAVFGSLSATQVRFNQKGETAEIEIRADSPSWSEVSSGVSYTIGLFYPGWYEFTAEFRGEENDFLGVGSQLEVRSDRWNFTTKAGPRGGSWRKVDIYFRPADSDPSAEISCRFWGDAANRTERAFLRNMRVARIDGAPPPMAAQFDLQKKEEARLGRPRHRRNGSFRSVWMTLLLLGACVGVFGWLFDGGRASGSLRPT